MSKPIDQELLPCPFCGDPNPNLTHDDYVHDDMRPMAVVECTKCHTWVQAEAWNKRAAIQPAGVSVPEYSVERGIDGKLTYEALAWNRCVDQVRRLNSAPHPVSGEQTTDQHNAEYWQEQYELLRKDYQRSLDERAQDIAGLVEAAAEMFDMLEWRAGDTGDLLLSNDQRDQWSALIAAHRDQQGEQP